jgi:hypothetical protein
MRPSTSAQCEKNNGTFFGPSSLTAGKRARSSIESGTRLAPLGSILVAKGDMMSSYGRNTTLVERSLQFAHGLFLRALALFLLLGAAGWLLSPNRDRGSPEDAATEAARAKLQAPIRKLVVSDDEQYVDLLQGMLVWRRYDAHTGAELQFRRHPGAELTRVALHRADKLFAGITGSGELELFGEAGLLWRQLVPSPRPGEVFADVSICSARGLLAAISTHGRLWIMEFTDPEFVSQREFSLDWPSPTMATIQFSPNGTYAALTTKTGELFLWDVKAERLASHWTAKSECRDIAWSGDERRILACGHDLRVRIWDVPSDELANELKIDPSFIGAVHLSHDGQVAAISDCGDIRLCDVGTGEEYAVLRGHRGIVNCLSFVSRDLALFSADTRGELRRWSIPDRREVWMID